MADVNGTVIANGTAKLGANNAFSVGAITLGGNGTAGVLDLNGFTLTNTLSTLSGAITNGTLYTEISPAGANVLGTDTLTLRNANVQGKYIADVTASGTSDLVAVQGNINLSGLTLELVNPELLDRSMAYTIATITGTRTGTLTPTNLPNSRWHVSYGADGGVRLRYVDGTLYLLK